ncbi:NADH-quinone oxidoreductase subunit NuoF family protein [Actinomadura rubrisoli]|uniref:NADH-quinone oxidoreductase subunit I n=1 Tax=Actinomadura rubrisoli TaxID=2530368 RepID=A0A4R5BSV2_9ACTN|nr:NADH-quinone oxidoreductase subunit NuoF family protein [Actinomadura rubrisoli]TDD90118.1 NADH-quinone oxidoreductase subunit I [Actinomadura rubrisoli]
MTALAVRQIGPPRLTKGLESAGRLDWDAHRALHPHPRPLTTDQLIALCEAGSLHGRGGAAFPFARKVKATADSAVRRRKRTVVVVNGTEGEPGSAKDKTLLRGAPHLILDGAALAATALGSLEIIVAVTDPDAAASVQRAIAERGLGARARVVRLPERFITGEGGALVRGINGGRPIPPGRKSRASTRGVDGLPTLLSNAETYAQLAVLAGLGPHRYRKVGLPQEPGTVLLTVTGSARFPAVVETAAGAPLGHLLDLCGSRAGEGVLVGGYHGAWLKGEVATRTQVSRAGLAAAGGALGAGIVMPLGRGTCPLGECARVARYLAAESAGQCGPCRLGLPDLAGALTALASGQDAAAARDTVARAARMVTGRGACAHPDGTARFVLSAMDAFEDDIARHVADGGCGRPVLGVLPAATDARLSLEVDWSRCDGHGLCADVLRGTVRMDEYDYPVIPSEPIPARLEADARRAVAACPGLALRLVPRTAHDKPRPEPQRGR